RYGLTRERPEDEVRDPALILRPELMRPADAAHAEDGASKPAHPRVVENVLVGGALRAAVRSVERARLFPGSAARRDPTSPSPPARRGSLELEPREIAVDRVRRQEENSRLVRRPTRGLEHVGRAERVHLEFVPRRIEAGRDRYLRREVIDEVRAAHGVLDGGRVAHVADHGPDTLAVLLAEPA